MISAVTLLGGCGGNGLLFNIEVVFANMPVVLDL